MARPKSRPKKQKSNPTINKLWPFMPRKLTEERSGKVKFASPPSGAAAACHMARFANSEVNIYFMPPKRSWDLRTGICKSEPVRVVDPLEPRFYAKNTEGFSFGHVRKMASRIYPLCAEKP